MKRFLSLAVLALAMLFAVQAAAQWHDNSLCDRVNMGGFAAKGGSGPGNSFNVRFHITPHYDVQDANAVRESLAHASILMMNDYALQQEYSVRFTASDWSATDANFTVYYDIYLTSQGYVVYVCFHGWSAGHLFRVKGGPYADVERALREALYETVTRVNNGWVCSD